MQKWLPETTRMLDGTSIKQLEGFITPVIFLDRNLRKRTKKFLSILTPINEFQSKSCKIRTAHLLAQNLRQPLSRHRLTWFYI